MRGHQGLAAVGVAAAVVALGAETAEARRNRPKGGEGCAEVYDGALKLERAGKLREASGALQSCARSTCDVFVQHQCTMRYARLEAEIPSVVPVVTDSSGAPVVDVRVSMNGQLLTSRIDGRGLAIDPGVHEFSFETDGGGVVATRRVVILQGQRNRPIAVSVPASPAKGRPLAIAPGPLALEPPGEAPSLPSALKLDAPALVETATAPGPAAQPRRWSVARLAPIVLAGVGLAGAGSYVAFSTWGRRDNRELAQCAPACRQSSVDHIARLYRVADLSMGVAVLGLGTAAGLLMRPQYWRAERPRGRSGLALDVRPGRSGASATISGAF